MFPDVKIVMYVYKMLKVAKIDSRLCVFEICSNKSTTAEHSGYHNPQAAKQ